LVSKYKSRSRHFRFDLTTNRIVAHLYGDKLKNEYGDRLYR